MDHIHEAQTGILFVTGRISDTNRISFPENMAVIIQAEKYLKTYASESVSAVEKHLIEKTQAEIIFLKSQYVMLLESDKKEEILIKRSGHIQKSSESVFHYLNQLYNTKKNENETIKEEITRIMALNSIIDQLIWALIIAGAAAIQYLLYTDRSIRPKLTQNYFLN